MTNCYFRLCPTLRNFLTVFLVTYILLLTTLLLKVPKDMTPSIQNTPTFLTYSPQLKQPIFRDLNNANSRNNDFNIKFKRKEFLFQNDSRRSSFPSEIPTEFSGKDRVIFEEPKPLSSPLVINTESGSFYSMGNNFYIFSAYYDDRKEDTFIRLLTLSKQSASRPPLFCHFKDEIYTVKRKAIRYELCENHNKYFGGYIFSCEVPEFLNSDISYQVTVSYGESKTNVVIPLKTLRPAKHKIDFVNSYIGDTHTGSRTISGKNEIYGENIISKNSNLQNGEARNSRVNRTIDGSVTLNVERKLLPLSFGVCVPPLFGTLSEHRLIEFIELTLLLGAQHIYFYKYDVSDDIQKVLSYYVTKGVVTVTSWELPSNVTSNKVWYNGQLLAHNDCLYRSMPHFDLVAFNDVDEFIVPHDNESTTWSRVFPELISNRTCGLSFHSAFYDPGVKDMKDTNLLTPKLVAKTKQYSKTRSKVMAVPWRVFEVGIHHISKQNKENWTVKSVDPSTAFLHHYRRCVESYNMACSLYERDDTINKRYFLNLKRNYDKAISEIFATT